MILIFASKLGGGVNVGAEKVACSLSTKLIPCTILNPHELGCRVSLEQCDKQVVLCVDGVRIAPKVVYMSTLWRCDSIARIPEQVIYPTVYRTRVQQFMQDLRFALSSSIWIPGRVETIEYAESKPNLLNLAAQVGLSIPRFTVNSCSRPLGKSILKKNLGYPFVVSLNRKKGVEVGVTTTNTLSEVNEAVGCEIWQWQEVILASAQVRSFVVGDRIWSVVWKKPHEQFMDLRQVAQVEQGSVNWLPYELSEPTKQGILTLMNRLGLTVAAPEFLITDQDEILIDLNPCGDWTGFFSEATTDEIVQNLANLLSEQL